MFDWVTEWWSVFVWASIWAVGIPIGFGGFRAFTDSWPDWDDGEMAACILWPIFLVLVACAGAGLGLAHGTDRLVRAIRKWWENLARARDVRKNSKIVKGKDDRLPKAVANPRNP